MRPASRMIALVLLSAVSFAIPLYAAIQVDTTEPAANSVNEFVPKQIQVRFNETPVSSVTKLNLRGPFGLVKLAVPVIDGTLISAAIVGTLPDGSYIATWQSAGADGHLRRGQFRFTVKTG